METPYSRRKREPRFLRLGQRLAALTLCATSPRASSAGLSLLVAGRGAGGSAPQPPQAGQLREAFDTVFGPQPPTTVPCALTLTPH